MGYEGYITTFYCLDKSKMVAARNRLTTVAKNEKNGFRTSNYTEIWYVRQVRYADYENCSP